MYSVGCSETSTRTRISLRWPGTSGLVIEMVALYKPGRNNRWIRRDCDLLRRAAEISAEFEPGFACLRLPSEWRDRKFKFSMTSVSL